MSADDARALLDWLDSTGCVPLTMFEILRRGLDQPRVEPPPGS